MALQGKIKVLAEFSNTLAQSLASNASSVTVNKSLTYTDGSGASQANVIWSPRTAYSVSESTNTDIDLSGSLSGTYGTSVFTAVKGLLIVAGTSNPGNLTVGNVTNGAALFLGASTHTIVLEAGAFCAFATPSASGKAITASTADLLRIASAATAGTYTWDVLIIGI